MMPRMRQWAGKLLEVPVAGAMLKRYGAARRRRSGPDERMPAPNGDGSLKSVFRGIGIDKDYSSMNFDGLAEDLQGWESRHGIFRTVFEEVRPRTVFEVGTWKGASVMHMVDLSRELGCGTEFVCVDTWLGSNDALWIDAEFRRSLRLEHGYPTMFRQFIYNVVRHDAVAEIFPLPMTSTCGAYLLRRLGLTADAIYIDAGHEQQEVAVDLALYHDLLRPGGIMFGDDYADDWPGLVRAVDGFCAERGLELKARAGKWRYRKPAA